MWKLAGQALMGLMGRGGKVAGAATGVAAVGGGAAAFNAVANPNNGAVGQGLENVNRTMMEAAARASAHAAGEGFYAGIEQIGIFISGVSLALFKVDMGMGLQNWARTMQAYEPTDLTSHPNGGAASAASNDVAPEIRLAEDGITPVTADSEITLENIMRDLSQPSWEGIGQSLMVAKDVGIDFGINLASIPAQFLDGADKAVGGLASLVGVDTGANDRDLSMTFQNAVTDFIYQEGSPIQRAELTSAWDRALYNGLDVATYFIPYAGVARLANDVSQGAENYVTTGDIFEPVGP